MKLHKDPYKFYFEVDELNRPRIDYQESANRFILLYCEVPSALRGQSWGRKIVKAVCKYIHESDGEIVEVRCGYIKK